MLKALILIKKIYKYFSENKTWILSILFVFSIMKITFWYALFGINILIYSTIQDIFISFADYFMSLIYIGLSCMLCLSVIDDKRTIKNRILSILLFVFFYCLFNVVFRMIVPVIAFILITVIFLNLYHEKKKNELLGYILLTLLIFTLVQPLEQFLLSDFNQAGKRYVTTSFVEKPANYDIFSFEYLDMTINTASEQFYYIGGNSNYYFILDRKQDEVMIIPKSECSNIKGTPISIKKISKMFNQ